MLYNIKNLLFYLEFLFIRAFNVADVTKELQLYPNMIPPLSVTFLSCDRLDSENNLVLLYTI